MLCTDKVKFLSRTSPFFLRVTNSVTGCKVLAMDFAYIWEGRVAPNRMKSEDQPFANSNIIRETLIQ